MPSRNLQRLACLIAPLALVMAAQADDLHIKKVITVGGNTISTTESSVKGARERDVNINNITLRQCDLKRTVTVNEQTQTYFIANDPVDENEARAAALATGSAPAPETGGKIVITTTITDTGERKQYRGYPVRHLKTTVVQEPSKDACTKTSQKFEIDGWYTDLSKEQGACSAFNPPVRQDQGCNDKVFKRHTGSAKGGYPLDETVTFHNADGTTTRLGIQASEITKQTLEPALFDIPAGYRQVNSLAELNGVAPVAQQAMAPQAAMTPQVQPQMALQGQNQAPAGAGSNAQALMQQAMHGATPGARSQAGQAAVWNQVAQMGMPVGQPLNGPPGAGQVSPMGMNPMAQMAPAAMSAQQQAMSQLAGFNQQIKSKDDVTVQYSLIQTGQSAPRIQNSLQGKAKSDGEDVLTPLLQQTANSVLTEATRK